MPSKAEMKHLQEDEHVEIDLTVEQVRAVFDGFLPDALQTALDHAQAPVFNGDAAFQLLLIRIVPSKES